MKKKINIIYKLSLSCIVVFSATKLAAQTGILLKDPLNPLHINAASNTSTVTDDVVVSSAGNLGVGVASPVTKVDLRSTDPQKGIIGVGTNTAQTASDAGGGAIRYNTNGYLEYSDGTQWIALPLAAPTKVLVNATKSTTQQSITSGQSTPTTITNWVETIDSGSNFDASTGIFTAPRDGFYLMSFNVTLASASIPNNTFIETSIESNRSTDNIQVFRTVNSYPAFQSTQVSNFVSGNCNAIFNLKVNDQVVFRVKHTTGTRSTVNDAKLNNISISEL